MLLLDSLIFIILHARNFLVHIASFYSVLPFENAGMLGNLDETLFIRMTTTLGWSQSPMPLHKLKAVSL